MTSNDPDKAPDSNGPRSDRGPDSAPKSAPGGLAYGILNAKRPKSGVLDRGYDEKAWTELTDLYVGGYTMQEAAPKYLKKTPDETAERYAYRTENPVAFVGYLSRIVGFFAAQVFQSPLHVQTTDENDDGKPDPLPEPEVYEAFANDADLKGQPFTSLIREAMVWAMACGKAYVCVDFPTPPPGSEPLTRADERALDLGRPYAWVAHPLEVIDWRVSTTVRHQARVSDGQPGGLAGNLEWSYGRFEWVVTKRRVMHRDSPWGKQGGPREEFKVWQKHPPDATHHAPYVTWSLFQTKALTPPKPPTVVMGQTIPTSVTEEKHHDEDIVPLIDHGEVSFTEIPVLEVTVPAELWIGGLVGPINLEHWQRRSLLVAAQLKALFALLYIKYGPQLGGVGSSQPAGIQMDAKRGEDPVLKSQKKGALLLGSDDDIGYAEPGGAAFGAWDQALKDLADEAYRVASQMAGSLVAQSMALNRSGASKAADKGDSAIVCAAYATIAKDLAVRVYRTIARARGEGANFKTLGLDTFAIADRADAIDSATKIAGMACPSPSLVRALWERVVTDLAPGLPPSLMTTITDEIKRNIPDKSPPNRATAIEEAAQAGAISIQSPTFQRLFQAALAGDILPDISAADLAKIKAEIESNVPNEPAEPGTPPPAEE